MLSTQTDTPVAHDVAPLWQAFPGGEHGKLARQVLQVPALQTWSVPHTVPFIAVPPVSMHVGPPESQAWLPV
jgi:hypothetical protein